MVYKQQGGSWLADCRTKTKARLTKDNRFETYFPHVDNVYSHRSTQKYKRKPFISHYWDCRMKGRPPGTPKTDDPSKKRRRRSARERDLCDVKIKITEYFPGSEAYYQAENGGASSVPLEGQKFWTIQRVNGNGGNGKGDGVAGPHKHTLERSDEIKKNSVQRWMAAQDREVKVAGVRRASGAALATIKRRAKDADIKFHAACYWYVECQEETLLQFCLLEHCWLMQRQPLFAACLDCAAGQGPCVSVCRDGSTAPKGWWARGQSARQGALGEAGRLDVCRELGDSRIREYPSWQSNTVNEVQTNKLVGRAGSAGAAVAGRCKDDSHMPAVD